MRFDFKLVRDGQGYEAWRPVFHFGVTGTTRSKPTYCLLDTGTPDVLVAADLAEEGGIDLTEADSVGAFALEGEQVTGRETMVTCVVVDGRSEIELPDIPVIFVTPWPRQRQFAGVLGTLGMEHIRVTVCAKEQWLEIVEEPDSAR